MALISKLTSLADAIRAKAGISGLMTLTEMASAVAAIETGGGLTDEDLYIMGMLTEVPSSISATLTSIASYAFTHQKYLQYASFPNCTEIGTSAFNAAELLQYASFPQCTSIGSRAFFECNTLVTAYIPKVSVLASGIFAQCYLLESVQFDYSACVSVQEAAFWLDAALSQISLPNCKNIGQSAFYGCSKLSVLSLPKVSYINYAAFSGCVALKSLYLLGSSAARLGHPSVFNNSPLSAGGSGTIYVPSSLYNTYKASTYWSVIIARLSSVAV